ncbi:transglycosylase family protein [Streptomyces sp. NPDC005336]|uniref:transglycosylase family protein n=1 Tax=Streptomyces sp. NPDC005336 TaxID=3157035 RepID=UPI0033A43A9A
MAARGRHRRPRPRRVSRASLAVTAGGAGVALPLIGVGQANAASVGTWDNVAECESANNWSINTGNGFYGGLQFTQSTWQAYGGTAHAARADLASKAQQIAVAEKVLASQGPTAWPICSVKAGLTRGGPAPDTSPGTPGSGTPGSGGQGSGTQTPKAATEAAPKAAPRATTEAAPKATPKATAKALPQSPSYTVARGDTLSRIADAQNVAGSWEGLYETNRRVIGSDPNLILPGQRLALDTHADAPRTTLTQRPQQRGDREQAHTSTPPKRQTDTATRSSPSSSSSFTTPVGSTLVGTPYGVSGSSWSSGHHTGTDFPVPVGTQVRAVGPAEVVAAGWGGAYGYQVVLRHSDGMYTQYAHMSSLSVQVGQTVAGGRQIGRSGSTGNSTGPHVHFEVRTDPDYGSDVNPLAYLRSKGVHI